MPMKISVFKETLDCIEKLRETEPVYCEPDAMLMSEGCRMYIDEGYLLSGGIEAINNGKPLVYGHGKDPVRVDREIVINTHIQEQLVQLYAEKMPDGRVPLEEFAGDCLGVGVQDKVEEIGELLTMIMEGVRRHERAIYMMEHQECNSQSGFPKK
jgi:hypothetical protein